MYRLPSSDLLPEDHLSTSHEPQPGVEGVKGQGKIHTFTVTYATALKNSWQTAPYALALVDLDEGFLMISSIIECDFKDLRYEMPVEMTFDPETPQITLPKFRPRKL